jgi:dolichol-phosphate mannosyltransferase
MQATETRAGDGAISVIVPTYNEAPNLPELLARIKAALDAELPYEVVIADDRSPDGTARTAERLAAELSMPLQVVTRDGPRSLSLAVIDGARAARHACVVVMDADLSHDPGEITGLAREVLAGRCDIAVASRYSAGGEIGTWPWWRRLLSRSGTGLARWLTRVRDPLSGFFACRREVLTGEVKLRPRGYKLLLEVLGRAPGLRVVERPTRFADRKCGTSKLGWRQKLEFVRQVFALMVFRLSTFRWFRSPAPTRRRAFS